MRLDIALACYIINYVPSISGSRRPLYKSQTRNPEKLTEVVRQAAYENYLIGKHRSGSVLQGFRVKQSQTLLKKSCDLTSDILNGSPYLD